MVDSTVLIPFILTSLTIILPPGPNTVYIATRSLNGGIKHGIISALGIDTGGFIYFLLASFGLSRLILSSSTAFLIIKYLGSAYLFYIGISTILSVKKQIKENESEIKLPEIKNVYFRGIITCLLNPKVGVFFIAFLPQFISINNGNYTTGIFTLGLIFAIIGGTWDITIAVISGVLSKPFLKNKTSQKYLSYISGSVLILLAITSFVFSLLEIDIT